MYVGMTILVNLFIGSVIRKSYCSDVNYNMTLNKTFSAALIIQIDMVRQI